MNDDDDDDTDRRRIGDDTGRRRRLSESEVSELLESKRHDDSANRDKRKVRDMELWMVEMFGRDGDGGTFAFVIKEQEGHGRRLTMLEKQAADHELFQSNLKVSLRWSVAIASLIATGVGALILVAVERILK